MSEELFASCVLCHSNLVSFGIQYFEKRQIKTHLIGVSKFFFSYLVSNIREKANKNALYWSVNVFSRKVLIENTIFTSPSGDETVSKTKTVT